MYYEIHYMTISSCTMNMREYNYKRTQEMFDVRANACQYNVKSTVIFMIHFVCECICNNSLYFYQWYSNHMNIEQEFIGFT